MLCVDFVVSPESTSKFSSEEFFLNENMNMTRVQNECREINARGFLENRICISIISRLVYYPDFTFLQNCNYFQTFSVCSLIQTLNQIGKNWSTISLLIG